MFRNFAIKLENFKKKNVDGLLLKTIITENYLEIHSSKGIYIISLKNLEKNY